jgi:predicted RNA-binding protein YlxR (DUF448 family)
VSKKRGARRKHIPQRTCVGCRSVESKRTLIRVVRCPEGLEVDPTGKLNGRGAYLHNHRPCWERGLKGSLFQALKVERNEADEARLRAYMETLPEETTQP